MFECQGAVENKGCDVFSRPSTPLPNLQKEKEKPRGGKQAGRASSWPGGSSWRIPGREGSLSALPN